MDKVWNTWSTPYFSGYRHHLRSRNHSPHTTETETTLITTPHRVVVSETLRDSWLQSYSFLSPPGTISFDTHRYHYHSQRFQKDQRKKGCIPSVSSPLERTTGPNSTPVRVPPRSQTPYSDPVLVCMPHHDPRFFRYTSRSDHGYKFHTCTSTVVSVVKDTISCISLVPSLYHHRGRPDLSPCPCTWDPSRQLVSVVTVSDVSELPFLVTLVTRDKWGDHLQSWFS